MTLLIVAIPNLLQYWMCFIIFTFNGSESYYIQPCLYSYPHNYTNKEAPLVEVLSIATKLI